MPSSISIPVGPGGQLHKDSELYWAVMYRNNMYCSFVERRAKRNGHEAECCPCAQYSEADGPLLNDAGQQLLTDIL